MRLPFDVDQRSQKQPSNTAGRVGTTHSDDSAFKPSKWDTARLTKGFNASVPVEPKSELHLDIDARVSKKQQLGKPPPLLSLQ